MITAVTLALAVSGLPMPAHPPMGWNSYDCFGYSVSETEVLSNATFVHDHLQKDGYRFIVVDYIWAAPKLGIDAPNQTADFQPRLNMDKYGRLLPDPARFPSSVGGAGFAKLAANIHKMGLKFGIHLMRGIPRQAVAANTPVWHSRFNAADAGLATNLCPWLNHMDTLNMTNGAGQAYLNSIFDMYAKWGVDFVKVDDMTNPYHPREIEGYEKAIAQCGRPIILSLSPGETPVDQQAHVAAHANMWRLLGDLWDNWPELNHAFDVIPKWDAVRGPGHWPDPDMLPLGRLRVYGPGTGPANTDSRFTRTEAQTLMTLWCISASPLLFGGDLPLTDASTIQLISNREVLAVDQDSTQNGPLQLGDTPVWTAHSRDHRWVYLALFNRTDSATTVSASVSDFARVGTPMRDLWSHKNLGPTPATVAFSIPPHGSRLVRLTALP